MPETTVATKVVLDTNVVIDFFDAARPDHQVADSLMAEMISSGVEICLAATSLKDVYYLLTQRLGEPNARRAVKALAGAARVLTVDQLICRSAADSSEPDLEDGLIMACAEWAGASWIVTRDKVAFGRGPIAKAEPAELLDILRAQGEAVSDS